MKKDFFKNDINEEGLVSEEILEVKEILRKTLDYSMESIFILDKEKVLYLNLPAMKLLEVEAREKIIGEEITKYIKCEFEELVRFKVSNGNKDRNDMQIFEGKLLTSKGKILDVEIAATFLSWKEKKEILVYVKDITNKRKMEDGLRDSEKLLSCVAGGTIDLISITDIDGNYKYTTPSFKDILGYEPKELIGLNRLVFIHPDDLNHVLIKLEKIKLTGNKTKMLYRAKCVDGNYIYVETVGSPIYDNNQIDGFIFSTRDISDRIEIENALRKNEEKYRNLVELIPYAIYIRNNDKILFSNKAGLELLKINSIEELKSKSINEIFIPIDSYKEEFVKNMQFIEKNGQLPLSEETIVRLCDNEILNLETMVTKFTHEYENAFLVLSKDISDRKKAEMLERDMKVKNKLLDQAKEYERIRTDFFANVSHELRTPINVILSALQVCNQFIESENVDKVKKYIGTMTQNCYRLIRLINNLIDTTKIDSGYFDINLRNCNIVSVVEEITLLIVSYVENKGISIVFDTDIEEKIVSCDTDMIERIILNLISNAIKFTEPGGSIVVNIADKEDKIAISVKDTGIGIAKEKQKQIFERFVQVDESLSKNREGSGIGLSLVKSLVEMHKGTIEVKSEYGEGSEFIIELPALLIPAKEAMINNDKFSIQDNIDKINIEFSDIYM